MSEYFKSLCFSYRAYQNLAFGLWRKHVVLADDVRVFMLGSWCLELACLKCLLVYASDLVFAVWVSYSLFDIAHIES